MINDKSIEKLLNLANNLNNDLNSMELEVIKYNVDNIYNELIENNELSKDDKYQLDMLYINISDNIDSKTNNISNSLER